MGDNEETGEMKTLSKAMMEAIKARVGQPPRQHLAVTEDIGLIGKMVRAQAPGKRAQMGVVIGETHEGKCWEIKTPGGMEVYNKGFVQAIPSKMAGKKVRVLKATLGLGVKGKIYGSGDLD